jgi:TrmH family RNA methyltransferase
VLKQTMRQPEPITSVENPRFRHWLRIAKRGLLPDGRKVLAVEGPKLVAEALACGWRPVLIAATIKSHAAAIMALPRAITVATEQLILAPHLFSKLADARTPQEPLVFAAMPDTEADDSAIFAQALAGAPRLLVADAIQDPGNIGALLRSAAAFGFHDFIATPSTATPASAKVLRASAGALFRMRLFPTRPARLLASELPRLGFLVVVLNADADLPVDKVPWRDPVAIVVGNEAHGPAPAWTLDSPTASPGRILHASIAMTPSCESLNAALAGGIALYEASRRLGVSVSAKTD